MPVVDCGIVAWVIPEELRMVFPSPSEATPAWRGANLKVI